MKKVIRYVLDSDAHRQIALDGVAKAPDGYYVEITEPTRTLPQNAKMWCMLGEISEQKSWYGKLLSDAEWKDVFTAGLRGQDVVPNIDGTGFVVLGGSTSKMSVTQMSDLIELMYAFAAEHKISFSDTERLYGGQHDTGRK